MPGCCCCGKASFELPKLRDIGDHDTDALALFSRLLENCGASAGPAPSDASLFLLACRRLAQLHDGNPRQVEMLIPQLCGACTKLSPNDLHSLESHFFVKCSAVSFHFAMLCCFCLLGTVLDLQPLASRPSSHSLSAPPDSETTLQQRLLRLMHRICCAAVARSKGLAEADGVKVGDIYMLHLLQSIEYL